MSEVRGIVVAHGDLAQALVRTVERISGLGGALRAVSNEGLGPERLRDALREAIGGEPAILFVDLASGSCGIAGLGLSHEGTDVAVLTGANIPMLLDFVFHRDLPLDELAARVRDKARTGIRAYGCAADPPGGS